MWCLKSHYDKLGCKLYSNLEELLVVREQFKNAFFICVLIVKE